VFDEMAAAVPQFSGHTHLSLIKAKGEKVG
jgi:hypothetical protein